MAEATVNSSSLAATGATENTAIYNVGNVTLQYNVLVNNSQIEGSTRTVYGESGFRIRIGGSQMSGGPALSVGGSLVCAGVYDENYVFSTGPGCP